MKSKIIIGLVVGFQVILIAFLFYQIREKGRKRLGLSVSPIDRKTIQNEPSKDLLYFYEPKPINGEEVRRDWLPYIAKYNINEDTLNDRFDYPVKKNKGIFRIITLGDSFTYGAYVNTQDNWTELLEDYLNAQALCEEVKKYEVINLGIWGYDFAYETERYARRGLKYNPDLIIDLVVDFGRVTEFLEKNANKRVFTEAERLKYRKNGMYYPEVEVDTSGLTKEYRIQYQLKQIKRLMSLYHNPLLLVDLEKEDSYRPTLKKIVKTYNTISLVETALSFEDKQYFLLDGHPNTEGHKAIMREMVDFLKNKKLIPCENGE